MDHPHAPGCDGNHTPRQRCTSNEVVVACQLCGAHNQPGAPRCARCGVALDVRALPPAGPESPSAPIGPAHRRAALSAELAPGLILFALYFVAAKGFMSTDEPGDSPDVLPLFMILSLVLGLGWFAVGRFGTGCALLALRFVVAVALLFLMIDAFSNDSNCYRGAFEDAHACYAHAIKRHDVVWVTFLLMPFTSTVALYLSMRRSPWFWPWKSAFSPVAALRIAGGVIAGILIVVGLPIALGLAYTTTGYGRSTLVVRNDTGVTLSTSYTPGYDPGEDIPPGATVKIRPLFDRFDDPREVSFYTVGDYRHWTTWRCQWDYAKSQEPLVVDFTNTAGCQMSTHDMDEFTARPEVR
ncbi:MAG TPA: hypothetical protein VJP07_00710 [Dehalococcoidia bacterium]|nr:hypothetical protein [Dehalococcoidia bacterium]